MPKSSTPALQVSNVRFSAAGEGDLRSGLLGWIAFDLNEVVRIDGVTVRETRDRRITLSFPARRDSRGTPHPYLRPLTDEVRLEIESLVLGTLGFRTSEARA